MELAILRNCYIVFLIFYYQSKHTVVDKIDNLPTNKEHFEKFIEGDV